MRLTKLMPKKALLLNTELTRFIQNSPVLNPVPVSYTHLTLPTTPYV